MTPAGAFALTFIGLWLVMQSPTHASAAERTKLTIACTAGTERGTPNPEFTLCKDTVESEGHAIGVDATALEVYGDANAVYDQYIRWLRNDPTSAAANDIRPDIYQVDMILVASLGDYFLTLDPCGIDPELAHGHYNPYNAKANHSESLPCHNITPDDIHKHFPAIIEYSRVNGRLKAMPWFVDIGLLYARRDLIEKYTDDIASNLGRPPRSPLYPVRWDELVTIAKTVQEHETDSWGFVWQGREYEGLTCNALEWVHSYGGRFVDDSGDRLVVKINDHNVRSAIAEAASWIRDSISPLDIKDFDEDRTLRVFKDQRRAVFMRHWPRAWWELEHDPWFEGLHRVDVMLLPTSQDTTPHPAAFGGQQLAVSNASDNKGKAVELILRLTDADVQKKRSAYGYLPTLKHLYRPDEIQNLETINSLDKSLRRTSKDGYGLSEVLSSNSIVERPSGDFGPRYIELSSKIAGAVHGILFAEDNIGRKLSEEDMRTFDEGISKKLLQLNNDIETIVPLSLK